MKDTRHHIREQGVATVVKSRTLASIFQNF